MGYNFLQGLYNPNHPEKYSGDLKKIVFRSSYELAAFKWCDRAKHVISWSSEEVVIPYISPVDNRKHRYFMDLKIVFDIGNGKCKTVLVEIKPETQTKPPRKGGKPEKYLERVKTYEVNQAKWAAAEQFAKERGWGFVKWTEEHLINGVQDDKEINARMREQRAKKRKDRERNSIIHKRAMKLARAKIAQRGNS